MELRRTLPKMFYSFIQKKTGSKDAKMLIFLQFMGMHVFLIFLSTLLSLNIFKLKNEAF